MIRDYIASKLQESQQRINNLREQERIVKEGKGNQDQQVKNEVSKASKQVERERELLLGSQSPSTISQSQLASAIYLYLTTTKEDEEDTDDDFRAAWQKKNLGIVCREWMRAEQFEEIFMAPKIDLDILPSYSFSLQFTFTLAQPYISHDEQDFYIIPNPVRRDTILGLPYVASTSWKGSLRAALWRKGKGYTEENKYISRLFGNKKGEEVQENLHAGRLYFFPTFFRHKALEMINPQNREVRAGEKPITFESVPTTINKGLKPTNGTFTLLYVPFDRVGQDQKETRKQVAEELKIVAEGLQAMFRTYGFGAKTSSGFGLAKEELIKGTLSLRATGFEEQKGKEEGAVPARPIESGLPHYLAAPGRLKPEYLTPEGTFRERSEAELRKMNSLDGKHYKKAKNWWEKEGKKLGEAANLSKPAEPTVAEPAPQAQPISWPEWPFESFDLLIEECVKVADQLDDGGTNEPKSDSSR